MHIRLPDRHNVANHLRPRTFNRGSKRALVIRSLHLEQKGIMVDKSFVSFKPIFFYVFTLVCRRVLTRHCDKIYDKMLFLDFCIIICHNKILEKMQESKVTNDLQYFDLFSS